VPETQEFVGFAAVLLWYVGWGVYTFVVYGLDKRAAMRSHRRTPEARLRKLELLGGAFGAAIAQRAFRHKSSKPGFRALTLLIAAVHGAVVCGVGWWVFAG
jgi:uncharacterized membrane protein YsdA (DUF1294 family)